MSSQQKQKDIQKPAEQKNGTTMRQMPVSEQPYELLEKYGASRLTDAQLLSCLISSGTRGEKSMDVAVKLLSAGAGSSGERSNALAGLCQMSLTDLRKIRGIGRVKAIQIQAMFELAIRLSGQQASCRIKTGSPAQIAALFYERVRFLHTEAVYAVYLNTKNGYLDDIQLGSGTLTESLVDMRGAFLKAYEKGAYSLVLVHSHPSGDPSPSEMDRTVTRRFYEAGRTLGVHLLDHIIVGDHVYYSFCENGYMDVLKKEISDETRHCS